jgi:hypothetical protein
VPRAAGRRLLNVTSTSARSDGVPKATSGTPHYWVVDLGEMADSPTPTAHHLAGEFGAVTTRSGDAGPVSGVFTTTEPFPVRIDLDTLV